MKKDWLLPHGCMLPGWLILIPSVFYGLYLLFGFLPDWHGISTAGFIENEIVIVCTTVGFVLAGFSRLRREDEYTRALRLDSLYKASYLHFALLIVGSLIWYSTSFIIVMFMLFFCVPVVYLVLFGIGLWRGTRITRPLLLPHRFHKIGKWMLILLTLPALYVNFILNFFEPTPVINNITIVTMAAATVLCCFSREKEEDEYISRIRLGTLLQAIYIQYGAFIVISLFSYNMTFVHHSFPLMYTLPLIQRLLFRRALRKLQR